MIVWCSLRSGAEAANSRDGDSPQANGSVFTDQDNNSSARNKQFCLETPQRSDRQPVGCLRL